MDLFRDESRSLQRRMASKPDTFLFLTIFALGFTAIFIFNIVAERPVDLRTFWGVSARILIPCILLIVYACVVWLVPKFKLTSEQAGDNCYYLGFIFTLISLAFALYDFVGGGDRILIVQDFGIALSTTIVGLLLRVLFSQSRLDPEHVESATREALTKSAREMRDELHRVTIDFNSFRRYYQQSLNTALGENQRAIKGMQEQFAEQQTEHTKSWTTSISAANEEFKRANQQLAETIGKTSTALSDFGESIEAKSQDLSANQKSLNEMSATLEKINTQLTLMSNLLDEKLIGDLSNFRSQILEVKTALEANEQPLNESVEAIGKFAKDVKQVEPSLEKLSKHASDINSSSRKPLLRRLAFWSKSG